MQKLGHQQALCTVLVVHRLGDVFEEASPSCFLLWN